MTGYTNFNLSRWRSIFQSAALIVTLVFSATTLAATGDDESLLIQLEKRSYVLKNPQVGSFDRLAFEAMNEAEKESFHNNRRIFLTSLARGLQLIKYGIGAGIISKDSISYKIRKYRINKLAGRYENASPGMKADILTATDAALTQLEAEQGANQGLGFRQRSDRIILRMLEAADWNLWSQAPLFARSNEFGLVLAVGVELLGGRKDKGWGGIFDIGVSVGYNRDTQALAIQIFRDIEHFKSTVLPAVFLVGVVGKAGLYIANQAPSVLEHEGTSYYPPMVPGFSSITADNFMAGLSSGLTWPPSPIGDMLTYTDRLNQNMVLRFTFSRLNSKFLRVQSGLTNKTISAVLKPIKKVIALFRSLTGKKAACEDAVKSSEDIL